jgi:hypothetical protein
LFEDTSTGCKLADPSKATSEEWALFDISCEISEISMATYGSITIATMLKQIARRNRAEAAKGQAEARG